MKNVLVLQKLTSSKQSLGSDYNLAARSRGSRGCGGSHLSLLLCGA